MAEARDDPLVRHALQTSFLADLAANHVDRLLDDAVRLDVPAGSVSIAKASHRGWRSWLLASFGCT